MKVENILKVPFEFAEWEIKRLTHNAFTVQKKRNSAYELTTMQNK